MGDVLVVFGSRSDRPVYSGIMKGLKERKISAQLRVCSAHRTPKQLDSIIEKSEAKLVIAGAGLSAALPGAIASKTLKPVIGVPVSANYAGLDSLLSIAQMPVGFPVIATGVGAAESAVTGAQLALQEHSLVKVMGSRYNEAIKERVDNGTAIATKLGLHFEFVESVDKKTVDPKQEILINAIEFPAFRPLKIGNALVLNVPVLRESATPEALEFFEKSSEGLWLGLNKVDNALIAAAQLLSIPDGKFNRKLLLFRQGLERKTLEADAEEGKKFG